MEKEVTVVIICGGEAADHKCNEDAVCYDTNAGRFIFSKSEAAKWYKDNYKSVKGGSVACSICGRVAIDSAMWL